MKKNPLILMVVFTLVTSSLLAGRATASSEALEQISLAVGGMMGI